jgi:hypothetical protein
MGIMQKNDFLFIFLNHQTVSMDDIHINRNLNYKLTLLQKWEQVMYAPTQF